MMFTGMAAMLAVWAASSGFWLLAGFAFGYGVFYGGFVAVIPALVMDYFGSRHISGIIGALYTSVAFGTLVGPSAAGFAFDLRHSYGRFACDHRRRPRVGAALRQGRRRRSQPG